MEQIEQDLLLSRLIVEIANIDYLGGELVFRGGTCLRKLHAPEPLRYSEDLDYVRSTGGGIRELTRAVTQIGERLGMEVRTPLEISSRSANDNRNPARVRTGGRMPPWLLISDATV